ncbi:MAG: hypothetical protein N2246_02130 [Candidatus Sumerlaeia bacterium]|nr:hypothetical protein [Candidatus Sumerlaeia bacterium]
MRKSELGMIFSVLLFAVIVLATYAQCPLAKGAMEPKSEEWVKCEMGLMCSPAYCQALKGAKVDVDNIDGGVIVTITTDNPTSASLIQQHWAKMKKALDSGTFSCPYAKGSGEYLKTKKQGDWKSLKAKKAGLKGKVECPMSQPDEK